MRACEEALRYDSPVMTLPRLASEDVELRGKQIKEKDRVRWVIPSANRDPDKFENGLTRWTSPAGPTRTWHSARAFTTASGATIARVEGQEVFKALADRYPNLEMVPHQSEYRPTMALRSMLELPMKPQRVV